MNHLRLANAEMTNPAEASIKCSRIESIGLSPQCIVTADLQRADVVHYALVGLQFPIVIQDEVTYAIESSEAPHS
jgi:hypothetical protein